jgi:hypothetical protein
MLSAPIHSSAAFLVFGVGPDEGAGFVEFLEGAQRRPLVRMCRVGDDWPNSVGRRQFSVDRLTSQLGRSDFEMRVSAVVNLRTTSA